MELIKLKHKGEVVYFLNKFPQSISKSGILEYWIQGEGYKKTKKFEIVKDVVMPERWTEMSWLEVAKIYDQYGIHVANEYAERKTAGIVSRQTIRGYGGVYQKIKHLNPDNAEFFELLRCDYMLSCFGMFSFDICGMDKMLCKKDSDYNPIACTYKGDQCSMKEYVKIKYGNSVVEIINLLCSEVMV